MKRRAPFGPLREPRAYQSRRQILVPSSPGPAGAHAHSLPAVPWRIRLREKWTGFASRLQPSLKARVGLADVVQRGGTLDHVEQVFGEAAPLRQRPCPCADCMAMVVQLHGDRTKRQFVEFITQGFADGSLDRQARYFAARFDGPRLQPADKPGPLRATVNRGAVMPLKYGSTGASPSGGVVVFVHSHSSPGRSSGARPGSSSGRPQHRGDRPRGQIDGSGIVPGTRVLQPLQNRCRFGPIHRPSVPVRARGSSRYEILDGGT